MWICTEVTMNTVMEILEKVEALNKGIVWSDDRGGLLEYMPPEECYIDNKGILYLYHMDNEIFWLFSKNHYGCEEVDNYSFVRMIELDY